MPIFGELGSMAGRYSTSAAVQLLGEVINLCIYKD